MKTAVIWETTARNYFLTTFMDEIKNLNEAYNTIATVNFFSVCFAVPAEPPSGLPEAEAVKELPLYNRLLFLKESIAALEIEGRRIGVEMNATSVVSAYWNIIGLMKDARNILSLQSSPHVDRDGDSGEDALGFQYWGDVDEGTISAILKDIYILLEILGRSDISGLSGAVGASSIIVQGKALSMAPIASSDMEILQEMVGKKADLLFEEATTERDKSSIQKKRKVSENKEDAVSSDMTGQVMDTSNDIGTVEATTIAEHSSPTPPSPPAVEEVPAASTGEATTSEYVQEDPELGSGLAVEVEVTRDREDNKPSHRSSEAHYESKVTRGSMGIVKRKFSDSYYDQEAPQLTTGRGSGIGGSSGKGKGKPPASETGRGKHGAAAGPASRKSKGEPAVDVAAPKKRRRADVRKPDASPSTKGSKVKAEHVDGDEHVKGDAAMQKSSSESSSAATSDGLSGSGAVGMDSNRIPRQNWQSILTKVQAMGHHLPEPLEGLMLLWARCLEVFKYRLLNHAKIYQASADAILAKARLMSSTAASNSAESINTFKEEVQQLLTISSTYGIQSQSW